jgi:hypothetical protein
MKRPIVVSFLAALLLLTGSFLALTYGQSPGTDLKPTFISPTPGLYVNCWPAFTVSYPKEWVVLPPVTGQVYRVGGTRPGLPPGVHMPMLATGVIITPLPLEDWAKILMPAFLRSFTDIKVLSDTPSRLKDGTPAREIEVELVAKFVPTGNITDVPKLISYFLLTKRDVTWIFVNLFEEKARFEEDLKRHAYSLTFLPGREKPAEVPSDVRAFLDMFCTDLVSRDVTSIMAHYSDRFFHSGVNKAFYERWLETHPESSPPRGATCEPTVTVFELHGDRAYVDGFFLQKPKDDTNALKGPMNFQQIIKEQGRWKWFGNQK